jgi:hypothetical protein
MTDTEAPPARSRALPIAVAAVAGLLVVLAAVVLPRVLGGDDEQKEAGSDAGGSSTVDTSNLDLVEEYDVQPIHVRGDVDYPQTPPVGGDHWDAWLDCGVYDVPVTDENAVHDLEHGSVWITYRADLVDPAGVADLAEQLPDNGILSPHPDQDAPVVITVWARQLDLVGSDDPRIAMFINEYGAGETAPEPWGTCAGGTADPGAHAV